MVDRISALAQQYQPGKSGLLGDNNSAGVILENIRAITLYQLAAWPQSVEAVAKMVANTIGGEQAPGPCKAQSGEYGTALRIEPLKWWLYGVAAPEIEAEQGSMLDISHSRTHVRVSGPEAVTFLNRHLSLDLREKSFPVGTVASSVIHHVGVTLWRSEQGYELFMPRGFALSLWQGLVESATQFGLEVV
jgi:heterotetrameric sarcosine oxidase gamma subunit